mgnify:CR=1 FL=1
MTKAELVTSIAEKTGLTKKDSEKALAAFVDTVTETLATVSYTHLTLPTNSLV